MNFTALSPRDLDRIAAELNARPRNMFGWRTRPEALAELLPLPSVLNE
jgi:IS30 family transposase